MTSLTLRRRNATASAKPYRLDVRDHGPVETDYDFVAALDADGVLAVMRAGRVRFLYSDDTGLTEKAAELGPAGALVVAWEREGEPPKEFSLSVALEDGTRIPIAAISYGVADAVVGTRDAVWAAGVHPMLDPEYLAEERRRRVADLRAEADRIEAGG